MTDRKQELREELPRLEFGVPGFDHITEGGLPRGRSTVVAGTSGSGKTIFGLQYLALGAMEYGQSGVLVTFEEPPKDLIRNVASFGWDFPRLIDDKKIAVVDASPEPGEDLVEAGAYDLSALMARIENAIRSVKAERVILDAIGAVFPRLADSNLVRRELQRIAAGLRALDVTTLITIERTEEYGAIGRYGIEEFVADNVVVLRNALQGEKRRRTIEVLKVRGATHQKGEYPFSIDAKTAMTIIPLSAIALTQRSSEKRISFGNAEVDKMCGGGPYRDSVILVSGATGTGKTLMTTEFTKAAIAAGEKALLFAFEESEDQLTRNAASWGVDYAEAREKGQLEIICRYPETMGLEDHLISMKRAIERFRPQRVAVDSLSALERVSSERSFREFVIGLTSHVKADEIAGLFTNTTDMLLGGDSITETHISTITDSIILLRYVELQGEMRRAITVLKMRGSWHDKEIREYVIDGQGMHVKEAYRGVNGILAGNPVYGFGEERERLGEMFSADEGEL